MTFLIIISITIYTINPYLFTYLIRQVNKPLHTADLILD